MALLSVPTRRHLLALHVLVSVGWIGALATYIVLDLNTALTRDPVIVRSAYASMDLITQAIILPLAYATTATGLIMALGTRWGLFRHYWVVISLVLTLLALLVLLSEARTVASLARAAADPSLTDDDLLGLPSTLLHSIGGMVVLLVVFVLNMYKPRGLTRYGRRKRDAQRA